MQQFFIDQQIELNQEIKLNEEIAYQCIHVLRYHNDKLIRCVDHKGTLALCRIRIDNESLFAAPIELLETVSEMKCKVTLIQALIRKERWEFILQKATELGVYRIVPIELKRNVVQWDKNEASRKVERYQKIMVEAAEQSKRVYVPKLEPLIKLNEISKYKSESNFVAYENENKTHLRKHINNQSSITIICGPEGGFDESEVKYLVEQGFISVSLGSRILRAETAGIYILSGIDFVLEGLEDE